MSKRSSPAVQVFIVVAVVAAFLYGFYCYHDQHTRLKRSEETVDKLKQKTESLSDQLQVLYDHKTRLESAVTQEKEIAKKKTVDFEVQKKELDSKINQQKTENAQLVDQLDSLRKKLEESEARETKVMEEHQQFQRENNDAVTKLTDELHNTRQRLHACYQSTVVPAVKDQQIIDDRAVPQANQLSSAVSDSGPLRPDEAYRQQDSMQVVAPKVISNQSLETPAELGHNQYIPADSVELDARQPSRLVPSASNIELQHRQHLVPIINVADSFQMQQPQQESNKLVAHEVKDEDYDNDIEKPQNL